MGFRTNGVDTGGLPEHLVRPLLDKYKIPFYVETGGASGDSVKAIAPLFQKCWTIELLETEVKDLPSNVTWLIGESEKHLPRIIKTLDGARKEDERQFVLFYLDAHYCGTEPSDNDYEECPVLSEIEIVSTYGEDAIIIIDDARLFFGHPPYPHDPREWPSICEIFTLLKEKFPHHHITITDDYVLAIPLHVRDVLDEEWRNRFHIRYPSDKDKLRVQVKDVYKAFMEDVYEPFMKYIK
jgi:hypothetical protein